MAQLNGSTGWLAFANEAVSYGTLGATPVYQQGISCKPVYNRQRITPPTLGSAAPDVGSLIVSEYWDVSCQLAYSHEADDVSVLYSICGDTTTNSHNLIGTPDNTSLSVCADYGGVEYDYLGSVPYKVTWNLINSGPSTMDISFTAKSCAKYAGAARTPACPPASEICLPGGLTSTFTHSTGTAIESLKAATITWERTLSGADRIRLGSSTIPQPINIGDRTHKISGSFTVELDTVSGNNSVAVVDLFLANTSLAAVVAESFAIGGCVVMGDMPELSRGMRDVTINWEATSLTVTTS